MSATTFGLGNGFMVMNFLILALGLAGGAVLGSASGRKKEEQI